MTLKTVGILGAGQLAKMTALAAFPLGIKTLCYAQENHCASSVTEIMLGDFSSTSLMKFASQVDVITFENENIDIEILEKLAQLKPIYPGIEALTCAQDRLLEKKLFKKLKIPTPNFAEINSYEQLCAEAKHFHYPMILKTRRFGYDGKGQYLIKEAKDLQAAWQTLNSHVLILEEFIQFDLEVSQIAVRNKAGKILFYPLTQNHHTAGILRQSIAPFIDKKAEHCAQTYTQKIMDEFDYVGVLAVEFFYRHSDLIANEIAPRVHNSGHWTMDGAACGQFENHLRAITDLPLGATHPLTKTAMFNCIGHEPPLAAILEIPGTHYHYYGKSAKAGRKLAHINLLAIEGISFSDAEKKIRQLSGHHE